MKKSLFVLIMAVVLLGIYAAMPTGIKSAGWLSPDEVTCNGPMITVGKPLNDLGNSQYISMNTGATGYYGGLYPNGSNVRPKNHDDGGLKMADQIQPRDAAGNVNGATGKIVLISIGMSNTTQEFTQFMVQANADPSLNPKLVLVDGARGSLVSTKWDDPFDPAWESAFQDLADAGVTPQQVQVAWVKLAQFGSGAFPDKAQSLQTDLEQVAQVLKMKFPNIKIAYYTSRSRAYVYGTALSPEPTAFETGFSVKWMIEKQINGDPNLNYDSAKGIVKAPFLAWGPYIWIDGLNKRSDGLIWAPQDLQSDCVHPSANGEKKVADQLMYFFKSDSTAKKWFLSDPNAPTPPPLPTATPGSGPTPTTQPGATPTKTPNPPPTGKYKSYASFIVK